jgi:uncharacterized protein YcfL
VPAATAAAAALPGCGSSMRKNVYDKVIVVTPAVSGSSSIAGSTKNTTGIDTVSPGLSVCSVKQKHSILLKYLPTVSGETLNVAVPVIGTVPRFTAS